MLKTLSFNCLRNWRDVHSASPNVRKSNTDSILRLGIQLNLVVIEYVQYSYAIAVLFYATVIEDLGVHSFCPFRPSVCLFVRKNFKIAHNFLVGWALAFIFYKSIPYEQAFFAVTPNLTLKFNQLLQTFSHFNLGHNFWKFVLRLSYFTNVFILTRPLTHFSKTWTLVITFEHLALGLSYFIDVFLVSSSSFG